MAVQDVLKSSSYSMASLLHSKVNRSDVRLCVVIFQDRAFQKKGPRKGLAPEITMATTTTKNFPKKVLTLSSSDAQSSYHTRIQGRHD